MMLDFNTVKGLTSDEIQKFNIFFNKKETLEKIEELERQKKEDLLLLIKIIIGVILFSIPIFLYIENSILLLILLGVVFIIGSIFFFLKSNKENIKTNLMGEFLIYMFGNDFRYSPSNENFSETVGDIRNKTNLLRYYDKVEDTENSIKYSYKLNGKESILLEGIEIETSEKVEDFDTKDTHWRVADHIYLIKLKFINSRMRWQEPINIFSSNTIVSDYIDVNKVKKDELENIEFEDNFDVYSNDGISMRQILTPNIMEKINNYLKKIGRPCNFYIENDTIYITYDVDDDFLEFPIFGSLYKNLDYYKTFYLEIKYMLNFVNEINFFYLDKDYFN